MKTPKLNQTASTASSSTPCCVSVLDVASGSRMFWFDRKDDRALFLDKRRESHTLADKSSKGGSRELIVDPDLQADFRALPFEDESFPLVVFDPPHLVRAGKNSWLAKKYGKLEGDWKEDLRQGFAECFRVLAPFGTLVFKWNENDVRVSEILALTPERPLFGNRCGKLNKSHWLVFQKHNVRDERPPLASGEAPAREADKQEACQKSRRDGGSLDHSVGIFISLLRDRSRRAFLHAEKEPDEMGRRLIEHGAWCYFNAARELEILLPSPLQTSGNPSPKKL